MVAKLWKDSRGSKSLQKSESWDGFWVLVLTPAAPIPLLSHRAIVLWCRWGVRPLHFIETHPASKGPVVACRGKMWQEVAQTKKSREMVAKMWKDSRGSRTLQKSERKSESRDGFWICRLVQKKTLVVFIHIYSCGFVSFSRFHVSKPWFKHVPNFELLYGLLMIQYDSCRVSEFDRTPLFGQMVSDKFYLLVVNNLLSNWTIQFKKHAPNLYVMYLPVIKENKTGKNISSIK